jgi:peptidoglycan hydrolase-like protein with peptidoglycan-binding domain
MRWWNPWVRVGFAILAQVAVGMMLAAGEWANEPGSSPPAVAAAVTASATEPQAGPRAAHVRELQQALASAGYDPGPIDGIFGPRTKAALRKYIAVPSPQAPSGADQTIARFRAGDRHEGP